MSRWERMAYIGGAALLAFVAVIIVALVVG
jgi:hypothetical protein